jgi:hypothetical protein
LWKVESPAIRSLPTPRQTVGRLYRREDFGAAGSFINMLRRQLPGLVGRPGGRSDQ